ncbi:MAG: acetyltransferase [Sneathiellales bacterium]|nr:acetyltransferase [Sneathiellales bacterium]
MIVALIGGGAQAKYAAEIFRLTDIHVAAVFNLKEDQPPLEWPKAYGVETAYFKDFQAIIQKKNVSHAVICTANIEEKKHLSERIEKSGLTLLSAIHPAARIATTATVASGCIINAGAVIQPFATIGKNTMIHANVIVEHDCKIGEYSNLGPGSQLAGWVQIGDGATVYTGASVIPAIKIGTRSIVGAGAVVTEDVRDTITVVGVPAKPVDAATKEKAF